MTKLRLIQLVDATGGPADGAAPSYAAMTTPAGLREVARYAYGIGPNKAMLWEGDRPTELSKCVMAMPFTRRSTRSSPTRIMPG